MSHNGNYYVKKKNKVKSRPITSFLQSTTSSSISSDSVFQSSIIKDAVPMLSSSTEMITTESSPISLSISESTSTQSTKSIERPLNSGPQSQVETLQLNAKSVPTLSICDFSLVPKRITGNAASSTVSILGKRPCHPHVVVTNKVSEKEKRDLRLKSFKKYEKDFPDFYYLYADQGWFCKVCASFASGSGKRMFIEIPGKFADHPTERANDHLSTQRHKTAVQNKQAFKELSKRDSNVWKLMRDASLANDTLKISNARFVIKSFFNITHTLVMRNWAHTCNFKELVELISKCGSKELKTHLLTAAGNANYMSPEYISKYISIMNDYIKNPLIKSLAEQEFTFFTDETSDVFSIEQLAVYATLENQGIIKEHFIGLIPMSKLVGSTLSAENIFRVLQTFFENIKVPLRLVRFACMDNTNVNSSIKGGLQAYLENSFPML